MVVKHKVFAREVKYRSNGADDIFVTRKYGGSINEGRIDENLNVLLLC